MSSVLFVPEQNQAMLKARLKKRPKATVMVASRRGDWEWSLLDSSGSFNTRCEARCSYAIEGMSG